MAGILICSAGPAYTVRIENLSGGVSVNLSASSKLGYRAKSPAREVRGSEVVVSQHPELIIIAARPQDRIRIDMEVDVPYGVDLQIRTDEGAITVRGLVRTAEVITETGNLHLASPWDATRLELSAQEKPEDLKLPRRPKFSQDSVTTPEGVSWWLLKDRLPELKITYGKYSVQAGTPRSLVLEDIPFPADSFAKPPWLAPAVLDEILANQKQAKRKSRPRKSQPAPRQPEGRSIEAGMPVFSSEVRMVNLTAAIFDSKGTPLTGLTKDDFEVVEDGIPQEVTFAGSEAVAFNLVLLLDLSGSTRNDRPAMKEAAKRFVDIARPHDRVATYALAANMMQVVSRLTDDRSEVQNLIESIPQVSGGSPLYDAIVLSYAEELRDRPSERNALIVISDGIDNQIYGTGAASSVSFNKLRKAAEGMNMLIYPVFLDPYTVAPAPGYAKKARENMKALADATGGRLFVAQSIQDLDPVYPLVAEELRSLYTVAYYPKDQEFDNSWRSVDIRIKGRPKAKIRTRAGYFAQ